MKQPTTPTYSTAALAADSVVVYTRDSFKAEYGHEAPPFQPGLAPKNWIDEKALTDLANGVDDSGNPVDQDTFKQYNVLKTVKNVSGGVTGWRFVQQGNNLGFLASINLPDRVIGTQINAPKLPDPVPFPVRDLLPNEKIVFDFAGALQVQRTDLLPTATTGGDSAALARIEARVNAIAAKLGV